MTRRAALVAALFAGAALVALWPSPNPPCDAATVSLDPRFDPIALAAPPAALAAADARGASVGAARAGATSATTALSFVGTALACFGVGVLYGRRADRPRGGFVALP